MPPPPRVRLHNKTGKLKNISNKNDNLPRPNINSLQSNPIASTSSSADSSASNELNLQQFELELCWCIQNLEKSLGSPSITPKVGR